MTDRTHIGAREHLLEEALVGLCHHLTCMRVRAANYLPNGDPKSFIEDIL